MYKTLMLTRSRVVALIGKQYEKVMERPRELQIRKQHRKQLIATRLKD